jgi:23S rRNA pseudouridine955/2504/2580 synthase
MHAVYYKEIGLEESGQRLDNYLIRILKGVPKSHIYRIIRSGEVRVNKKRAKVGQSLQTGDTIRIPPLRVSEKKTVFVGQNMAEHLREAIVYEDSQFLVMNKPAGIAVHGGSGVSLGIIEGLRKIREDLTYLELVHRLDRETSGCLLLAKKRSVLRALQALFANREVTKTYWALGSHPWKGQKSQVVTASLEKNILQSGERMVSVSKIGKPSETRFTLLENYQNCCLLEANPQTGRTHQIRVHSAYIGHSIVGDTKYGYDKGDLVLSRQLYLHARSIRFTLNGMAYTFQAELDEGFSHTLKQLRVRSFMHDE